LQRAAHAFARTVQLHHIERVVDADAEGDGERHEVDAGILALASQLGGNLS
jgi:hypothetical protein